MNYEVKKFFSDVFPALVTGVILVITAYLIGSYGYTMGLEKEVPKFRAVAICMLGVSFGMFFQIFIWVPYQLPSATETWRYYFFKGIMSEIAFFGPFALGLYLN